MQQEGRKAIPSSSVYTSKTRVTSRVSQPTVTHTLCATYTLSFTQSSHPHLIYLITDSTHAVQLTLLHIG